MDLREVLRGLWADLDLSEMSDELAEYAEARARHLAAALADPAVSVDAYKAMLLVERDNMALKAAVEAVDAEKRMLQSVLALLARFAVASA